MRPEAVRDKALRARIKALAIPPAWADVCIAEDGNAHIQAIGRDAEGRLQYRYHPELGGHPVECERTAIAALRLSSSRD